VIVSFPMVSQITVRTIVQNVSFVSTNEKEHLSVGVQLDGLTANQLSVMAQYMAQFGDIDSIKEFRDSGFDQVTITPAMEYGVVRTEEDYREVLNLRHLAYIAEGKISADSSVNEVADIHDSRARILMCRFRGKTIATARLTFHEHGDITEHEEFVAWPNDFPRRDESVEVTRACTHPEFRRTGLFFALLRHVVITATQAGRSWVVTSSTEDLVPLYRFVGLANVGVTYNHPDLNNLKHVILIGNIHDALSGRSVGPTAWNQVWKDALPYMSSENAIAQDTLSRIRIALYRFVGPLLAPLSSAILKLKR
jgi:GNAT superfamily N-acetyltransferase